MPCYTTPHGSRDGAVRRTGSASSAADRRAAKTARPHRRSLDPGAHRVARGDVEIRLSGTEFSLLHFLMRRARQTVPRGTLIEAVWGYESSIESNTLDAFIHLLRTKVDSPPRRRLIHTVRGVGYSLRESPPA